MPPYHADTPTCHPDRKHHARGLCEACYHASRSRKKPHKGEKSTYTDTHWGYRLKHWYGISIDQYNALNDAQHGLCAICGQPPRGKMKRLSVDHDHTTNKVRGLLCVTCNRAIGYLENPTWSAQASKYLKECQDA